MPLTSLKVRTEKKEGRYSDGGGLYLLVQKSKETGAIRKSWVLRVQSASFRGGRRVDLGLGGVLTEALPGLSDVPLEKRKALTLAEARDKARIWRELAKSGVDPADVWNVQPAIVPTFQAAAEEYHKEAAKGWSNGKHGDQWLTSLQNYAFPKLGGRSVDDIEASDIQAALLPIWLSIPETARRVRQRILAVLDYAHGKQWRDKEAPARALNQLLKAIKQPEASHFEAMPYKQLPAFYAGLVAAGDSVGRLALQFLILTGARSGEVRNATWGEVDMDKAEWQPPIAHMKARNLHIVPLSEPAMDILRRMQGLFGHKPNEPIFPGMTGKPMSDATLSKVLRVGGGGNYTVHGFRSTFRDWAADTGMADAWAEAALAHKIKDKVEAAYKRTTYFDARRDKLMPAWASFATGDASNVVKLAERAA